MTKTNDYYEDEYVLITFSKTWGEPMCVLAGATGKTKAICVSTNFFSPSDIVIAYAEVLDPKEWDMDAEEINSHLDDVKNWLIENGCNPEELE